jgi:hypothetical protein
MKDTKTPAPAQTAVQKANEKAAVLTEKYKPLGIHEVIPLVFKDEVSGEDIVGFFKEPSRSAKMAVMDKSVMGAFSVVEEILPTVFIAEESDPRFMSEDQAYDAIHMGFVMAVYDRIKFKTNTAKKK